MISKTLVSMVAVATLGVAGPAVALAMPQHHSDTAQPTPAVSTLQHEVPVTAPTVGATIQVPLTHNDSTEHAVSSTSATAVHHASDSTCSSHDGTEVSHDSHSGATHDTGEAHSGTHE